MRVSTGESRPEYALLARCYATSRATDGFYLFEGGLHAPHRSR